jgi:tetratricopeptide (TPR) repeat protein
MSPTSRERAGPTTPLARRRLALTCRLRRSAALCVLELGLLARTGSAADPLPTAAEAQRPASGERVVALNEEGGALYAAGDYRRAAERFLQAYAVDADPNLLFNIASCYEALGDIDAALEKYRAFLAAPDADPEGRPRAEQAIARLTELESAPADASQLPEAPATATAPAVPTPAAAPADTPRAPDADWVPWAGLGGGVALGALGATFYWLGSADHAEVTDTPGFDEPDSVASITRGRANALVRSGDTKKAIGVASASAGAALLVGSVVWWLVDPARPSSASPQLEVTFHPSQAGLRFNGAF